MAVHRSANPIKAAAAMAYEVLNVSSDQDHLLLRRAWTLPVLTSLYLPGHFNDIRRSLPAITDRALSQSLRQMEERRWVRRDVDGAARPPRPLYSSINLGREISQITGPAVSFAA